MNMNDSAFLCKYLVALFAAAWLMKVTRCPIFTTSA